MIIASCRYWTLLCLSLSFSFPNTELFVYNEKKRVVYISKKKQKEGKRLIIYTQLSLKLFNMIFDRSTISLSYSGGETKSERYIETELLAFYSQDCMPRIQLSQSKSVAQPRLSQIISFCFYFQQLRICTK